MKCRTDVIVSKKFAVGLCGQTEKAARTVRGNSCRHRKSPGSIRLLTEDQFRWKE